jgi:transaldolase
MTGVNSVGPLERMTMETPTEYWNDSCAVDSLRHAVERGATGATSNPAIVSAVIASDRPHWNGRIRELASENPSWSEVEIAWALVDEAAALGAAELRSVFEASGGLRGRQCVQVNPANHRDSARMVEQARHFDGLAPNIQVKFPATAAGIVAIEEATALGINTCSTVSFTVSQALAAAVAVERGLDRRTEQGLDISTMTPIVVLMIGRLDDWLRVVVERDGMAIDPAAPHWSGIAVLKRTYGLFLERGYRSRILAAATRHLLHWTELVGGDLAMTLTPEWQERFDASGIAPEPRIDRPVDPAIVAELERIPDFQLAYEPDGLESVGFDDFGATRRTLRAFTEAYDRLLRDVRDVLVPDPDEAR